MCLAAHDKGLGTCLVHHAGPLPGAAARLLPGSDEKRLVVAVTLGYPDLGAPANTFERSARRLDELVTWVASAWSGASRPEDATGAAGSSSR